MKRKRLKLPEEDWKNWLVIVENGRNGCLCHRARTFLYSDVGWQGKAIAEQQNTKLDTVFDRHSIG
jgi:hypothetical protein